MKLLLGIAVVLLVMHEIVCPPVQPAEANSPEEDLPLGLEYDRYLREIVMALEEDDDFRKKLEDMNISDIKDGKIARHLELVDHQIREKLDEIKRQEIGRLRILAKDKMKQRNGMQVLANIALYGGAHDPDMTNHIEVRNPHSFEEKDLELLIKKATSDLDQIDKARRGEFKEYEMEKEFERREELKKLDEEHRKQKEEEHERMQKRHKDHPKVHHPGSKAQLEEVWDKKDHMDADTFEPKTFFKMHDLNGDQLLDQEEIEALFQQELDQIYDPNLPEDDMRERYEEMARMREHVFTELDQDKDKMISLDEFLNYTSTQDFNNDEGWKTVDEEEQYTEEEYRRYEEMMREHEEKMRNQNFDPNLPTDNFPAMEMNIPEGGQHPGMGQGMGQGQHPQMGQGQHPQMGQGQHVQMGQGQMGGMPPGGQMPPQGQMPQGRMPPQGQMPHGGQMPPQGQMHQGQMPQMGQGMPPQGQMPQMGQGMPPQGQMPHGGQMPPQGQMGNMPQMGQGMPPGHMPPGQGLNVGDGPGQQDTQGGNVPQGQGSNVPQGQNKVDAQIGQGNNVNEQQKNVDQGQQQNQGQENVGQQLEGEVVNHATQGSEIKLEADGVKVEPVGQGAKVVAQAPPQGEPAGQGHGQVDGGPPMGQGAPGQGQPLKFESQHQQQQQQHEEGNKPLV